MRHFEYWSACKNRLVYREVESITIAFDPLSSQSHFLSDYHIALLEQMPVDPSSALSFDALYQRVSAHNDVEDGVDLQTALSQALDQMLPKALAESRQVAA